MGKECDRVRYRWLDYRWDTKEDIDNTKKELQTSIKHLRKGTNKLCSDARVPVFIDEHDLSLFSRVLDRMILVGEEMWHNITTQEISVLFSIAIIILIGVLFSFVRKAKYSRKISERGQTSTSYVQQK